MNRYTIPPLPETPPAESIARSLLMHADRALLDRVNEHRARYRDFWESATTPAEILTALGANALRFLFDAAESVRHITHLACGPAIEGMTPDQILETLHTILPPESYQPRLPLAPHEDGTVTVEMIDGLDAWGRLIPAPEIATEEEPPPEEPPVDEEPIPFAAPFLAAVGRGSGWLPEPPDARDYPLAKLVRAAPVTRPSRHELGHQSPVRDQAAIGSCVGFAATAAVEYLRRAPEEDHWETLYSPLFTYYHARLPIGMGDTDSGAYLRDAVKSLAQVGAARESDWLYYQPETTFRTPPAERAYQSAEAWKLGGYYRCAGLAEVKQALAAGFPVVGGFNCYANLWQAATSGIVPLPAGSLTGGHAVLFMGYDDATKRVKFKNSWGTGWGDAGYGYLPYAFFESGLASDLWALQGEAAATR